MALSSDAAAFGGSDFATGDVIATEAVPYHGFAQSLSLALPPLAALVLLPEPGTTETVETIAATDEVPAGAEVAVPAAALEVAKVPRKRRKPKRHGAAFANPDPDA